MKVARLGIPGDGGAIRVLWMMVKGFSLGALTLMILNPITGWVPYAADNG
jgi:hypothetical protein